MSKKQKKIYNRKMKLPLEKNDKENMIEIHRKSREKNSSDRIKAILMIDKGYSHREIAETLLIDRMTVERWKSRFSKATTMKEYLEKN